MRTAAAALALCAGLFAAGPASAGLFDDEIARKQIAEQQKRVDELRQQNDGMAGRLAKLEEDAKAQPVLALVAEIDIGDAEALRVAFGPFEIVHQAPVMIAANFGTIFDGAAESA